MTVAYLRRPEQQFKLTFAQFTQNPNMLAADSSAPEEPAPPTQQPSLTALMRTIMRFFKGGFDVTLSFTPRKPPARSTQTDAQSQKAGDALDALREFITR